MQHKTIDTESIIVYQGAKKKKSMLKYLLSFFYSFKLFLMNDLILAVDGNLLLAEKFLAVKDGCQ